MASKKKTNNPKKQDILKKVPLNRAVKEADLSTIPDVPTEELENMARKVKASYAENLRELDDSIMRSDTLISDGNEYGDGEYRRDYPDGPTVPASEIHRMAAGTNRRIQEINRMNSIPGQVNGYRGYSPNDIPDYIQQMLAFPPEGCRTSLTFSPGEEIWIKLASDKERTVDIAVRAKIGNGVGTGDTFMSVYAYTRKDNTECTVNRKFSSPSEFDGNKCPVALNLYHYVVERMEQYCSDMWKVNRYTPTPEEREHQMEQRMAAMEVGLMELQSGQYKEMLEKMQSPGMPPTVAGSSMQQ